MSEQLWFFDVESYYDDEYSLRKLTPPEYILDDRWETIMLAAKEGNSPGFLVDGPDVGKFLRSLSASKCTTVCFNALFDSSVFAWLYGFRPVRMLCSMRMAVAVRGHELQGHSLAAVGRSLGVGVKGTEIENVKGLHRAEIISSGRWPRFVEYALNDNEMNAGVFWKCAPDLPSSERRVMDRVLRCAIEPEFQVDQALLRQYIADLDIERVQLLAQAGVSDPSELRSTPRFEALLKSHGVDIEYKTTATGNTAPAFAKTDEFMEHLQAHDDPVVAALACARLGVRSTIAKSRAERILAVSNCHWEKVTGAVTPMLPIPLNYSAAHTHRLGGTWLYNMQNLPTGRGGVSNKLRCSVIPGPGRQMVVADKAQIECRVNAWFCGQEDLLELFRQGLDPYSVLASGVFGYIIDKNIHKLERFIGKSGELGLGFQCGAEKFYNMVIRSARVLGMDIPTLLKVWTPELAQKTVNVYRAKHGAIRTMWATLDSALNGPWLGIAPPRQIGPVEIGHGYVLLPNGMKMQYKPVCTDPNQGLTYSYNGSVHPIYGGKFLENIVQALARILLMNTAMRLWDRGYKFKLQAHDELAFPVADAAVPEAMRVIHEEFTRPCSWAPTLPLGADVTKGPSYGAAK